MCTYDSHIHTYIHSTYINKWFKYAGINLHVKNNILCVQYYIEQVLIVLYYIFCYLRPPHPIPFILPSFHSAIYLSSIWKFQMNVERQTKWKTFFFFFVFIIHTHIHITRSYIIYVCMSALYLCLISSRHGAVWQQAYFYNPFF